MRKMKMDIEQKRFRLWLSYATKNKITNTTSNEIRNTDGPIALGAPHKIFAIRSSNYAVSLYDDYKELKHAVFPFYVVAKGMLALSIRQLTHISEAGVECFHGDAMVY